MIDPKSWNRFLTWMIGLSFVGGFATTIFFGFLAWKLVEWVISK
jgi:hypothetical protein